jgi:type II secretory pathway component PulF
MSATQETDNRARPRVTVHSPFGRPAGVPGLHSRTARPGRRSTRHPGDAPSRSEAGHDSATRRGVFGQSASLIDVSLVANDLRAMVSAGMPLGESLSIVARGIRRRAPKLASALEDIRARVEQGKPLGEAFAAHIHVFGELCVEMVAAGEQTGRLDEYLADVAADYEHRHRNRATIVSAFIEPAIIVAAGIVVAYLILAFTVPRFRDLYDALSTTATLPLATRILVALSDAVVSATGVAALLSAAGCVVAAVAVFNRNAGLRFKLHAAITRIPMFGSLVVRDAVARGCRTFGVAIKTIGDVPSGLAMASRTCGNLYIGAAFERAAERVRQGRTIAESLEETGAFPEMAVWMVHTGERSGTLDDMMPKLAEGYETQVRVERERLLLLLRPALLVVMGGFVLSLMLAMYLPVFTLVEQLQQR